MGRYGQGMDGIAVTLREHFGKELDDLNLKSHLPENGAPRNIANAMASAHQAYGEDNAVVVFIIEGNEKNIIDQCHLEHLLWEEHGIQTLRKTLQEVHDEGSLDD